MLKVKRFKCVFRGCSLGAIGIYQDFVVTLECTEDEIIPRLYEKYEHIHTLAVLQMPDDSETFNSIVDSKIVEYFKIEQNWKYKTHPSARTTE